MVHEGQFAVTDTETVAIVGVGLIGGSIGLALRARGLAKTVVGIGRDPAKLEEAVRLGAIDRWTRDMAEGVARADAIAVCTPVTRIPADCLAAAAAAPGHALIFDAGSTKARIVAEAQDDPGLASRFVGAHPVAGSERQGVAHARADLFHGRACVLTPTPRTPRDRLERARAFWDALGSRVVEMTPEEHDRALAYTSHLPHAVAAALALATPESCRGLTAGAFRDGTRVADSDADLWAGILIDNRAAVLEAIAAMGERLEAAARLIRSGDPGPLRTWWGEAAERRRLVSAPPEPSNSPGVPRQ